MITLTQNAVNHLTKKLSEQSQAKGFRLGLKKAGCNGYLYVPGLAEHITESDKTFICENITVVIDKNDLNLLEGTEIDYKKDGLNSMLTFKNPNAEGECGCGESFNIAK